MQPLIYTLVTVILLEGSSAFPEKHKTYLEQPMVDPEQHRTDSVQYRMNAEQSRESREQQIMGIDHSRRIDPEQGWQDPEQWRTYVEPNRLYQEQPYYHEVVTEANSESYFSHVRPAKGGSGVDLAFLGMVGLLKLLLIKAKTLGIALAMLVKLPVILTMLLAKLLIAVKAFKLAKLLILPALIPFLLPLLVAPLLLLPLLLPLLLLLPIPALTPAAAAPATPAAGRRRRQVSYRRHVSHRLQAIREILDSERCLERIACQMAAANQPPFYSAFIAWSLGMLQGWMGDPKVAHYTWAYNRGRDPQRSKSCQELYLCSNLNLSLS